MKISELAAGAGVNVETVRYYQRRGLLHVPKNPGIRRYDNQALARLRFIRHAKELGFTLADIESLLNGYAGDDRITFRRITAARIADIEAKIDTLQKIRKILAASLAACEQTDKPYPCPIQQTILNSAE